MQTALLSGFTFLQAPIIKLCLKIKEACNPAYPNAHPTTAACPALHMTGRVNRLPDISYLRRKNGKIYL
jgi:hypothetical protein